MRTNYIIIKGLIYIYFWFTTFKLIATNKTSTATTALKTVKILQESKLEFSAVAQQGSKYFQPFLLKILEFPNDRLEKVR